MIETIEVHFSVCLLYDVYDDCFHTHVLERRFRGKLLYFDQTDAIEVCIMMLLANLSADYLLFML